MFIGINMSNESIAILYDHYKDTCSTIGTSTKRRDLYMLYVLLALALFAIQALFPSNTSQALNGFIDYKFGINIAINFAVIGNAVWFLLLIFTLRYFQTAVYVERQYQYLHILEDKINKEFDDELITREGKGYLSKYPKFSNWMWILYTLIFPLLLFAVSTTKIGKELVWSNSSISLFLNILIYLLLAISIFLYLGMLHFRNKK